MGTTSESNPVVVQPEKKKNVTLLPLVTCLIAKRVYRNDTLDVSLLKIRFFTTRSLPPAFMACRLTPPDQTKITAIAFYIFAHTSNYDTHTHPSLFNDPTLHKVVAEHVE